MATKETKGGIRKRGNSYSVLIRKVGHKPYSKTFRTKTEAKAWKDEQNGIDRLTRQYW